jgi:hypothetical protein
MLPVELGNCARQLEWVDFRLGEWLAPISKISETVTPPLAFGDIVIRENFQGAPRESKMVYRRCLYMLDPSPFLFPSQLCLLLLCLNP